MGLGLFLVSASILALQVLHMRILSVQMWYHHAYVVVTMAMLGFAVAGTASMVWRTRGVAQASRRAAWCSILFGPAVVGGHAALTHMAESEATLAGFTILLLPYFFGGMVVTLVLSAGERLHRLYFINLVGSALGAWLFILLIAPLGAERLLIVLGAVGPLAALTLLRGESFSKLAAISAVLSLLVASGLAVFQAELPFLDIRINPEKRAHVKGEIISQRWTPLARLDLVAETKPGGESPDLIHIVQDGAAGTHMFPAAKAVPFDLLDSHAIGYVPHARRVLSDKSYQPSVAIIGIGGGNDIYTAKRFGAGRVVGLEINQEMVQIAGVDYADFNGGVFQKPGVEIVVGEGRSTLERMGEKHDVIILAGADTYTAGAYGAFVLSESYLYTNEALDVYLDHLNPGGTASILRFYDEPQRETLRLFGMAMLALQRRGVDKPSAHVAIGRASWSSGTVMSNEPFTPEDIALFKLADETPYADDLNESLYVPGQDKANAFTAMAKAMDEGKLDEFYASYRAEHDVDIRPVSDDSPFFFNFHHMWQSQEFEDSAFSREFNTSSPIAPSILRRLLMWILGLVGVLVILPLLFIWRREPPTPVGAAPVGAPRKAHTARQLVFFLSIGMAFMFLEISTAQRLVLFLGHPTYSLTVVLFSFLLFAGFGSWFSGRFAKRPSRVLRKVGIVLCIMIVLFTIGMRLVLPELLSLELQARIGIAIGILAPLNFVMGMPFPLALGRLKELDPKILPWAIGANGGASVIGSVFAVGLAMETGFTVVAAAALVVYAFGIYVATSGPLRDADPLPAPE